MLEMWLERRRRVTVRLGVGRAKLYVIMKSKSVQTPVKGILHVFKGESEISNMLPSHSFCGTVLHVICITELKCCMLNPLEVSILGKDILRISVKYTS